MASKIDKRLLGTWKSDRRKTFKDFVWPSGATEKGRRKLKALFGRLTVRYSRQKIYSRIFDTDLGPNAYEVLGSDSNSVAILCKAGHVFSEGPCITHIHFEGDRHYWIYIPLYPHNREWFKRVDGDRT